MQLLVWKYNLGNLVYYVLIVQYIAISCNTCFLNNKENFDYKFSDRISFLSFVM